MGGGRPAGPAGGIPAGQATQAGLTISAGVTPAFWIYCAFVLALVMICVWMLWPARRPVPLVGGRYPAWPGTGPAPGGMPWHGTGDLVPAHPGRPDGPEGPAADDG